MGIKGIEKIAVIGAGIMGHVAGDLVLHVVRGGLVVAPPQVGDHPLEGGLVLPAPPLPIAIVHRNALLPAAVEDNVQLALGKLPHRHIHRDVVMLGHRLQKLSIVAVVFPAALPGLNSPVA